MVFPLQPQKKAARPVHFRRRLTHRPAPGPQPLPSQIPLLHWSPNLHRAPTARFATGPTAGRHAPRWRYNRFGQLLDAEKVLPSHPQNGRLNRTHFRPLSTQYPGSFSQPNPSQIPLGHSDPLVQRRVDT